MKTARLSVQFVVLSSLVILLGNTIGSSQNCTALYGLTYSGGEDNLGVLFHLEPGTHSQVIDYSFPVENPGATLW
ncbi:MAG: hypothetical protein IPH45_18205 [Bacteroidales bacterium]|nr:hypothetical protein [Bacteroidales bacterium]